MSRSLLDITLGIVLLGAFAIGNVHAQQFPYTVHETDGIPAHVYAERRARLLDSLPPRSIAIVLSADIRNRQNDVDYEYRQNSDLLYLTGFPYPHCVLVLCKEPVVVRGVETRELFFVRKRNAERELWQGVVAGPTEAEQVYGLVPSLPMDQLTEVLDGIMGADNASRGKHTEQPGLEPSLPSQILGGPVDTVFIAGWATKSVPMPILGRNLYVDSAIKKALADKYKNVVTVAMIPGLVSMREVKDSHELRLIQKAVDITVQGHRAALRAVRPGMREYEIEAEIEYVFKKLGAEDVGYPSIVGSHYNACILHYTSNRRATHIGDLVLADCGAEYHGYTADVTRTFPVNGRFTPDQRTIYNIVLEAQDSGIAACTVGADFKDPHNAAMSVIGKRLQELNIIDQPAKAKTYFMHGTSHYLGLDVHDPGTRGPLKPNTVLTVEPGIYIAEGSDCDPRWWNIGIRIEDDILVTQQGPVNMSASLARTPEDVEAEIAGGR